MPSFPLPSYFQTLNFYSNPQHRILRKCVISKVVIKFDEVDISENHLVTCDLSINNTPSCCDSMVCLKATRGVLYFLSGCPTDPPEAGFHEGPCIPGPQYFLYKYWQSNILNLNTHTAIHFILPL